jgi:hypothetical protein
MVRCPTTGKHSFRTNDDALGQAVAWLKPGKYFRVYQCPFCQLWHLTTQPYRPYAARHGDTSP